MQIYFLYSTHSTHLIVSLPYSIPFFVDSLTSNPICNPFALQVGYITTMIPYSTESIWFQTFLNGKTT